MPHTGPDGGQMDGQPRPILVVDDDLLVRQTIRWVLEEDGHRVETAADGQQAIAWLASSRPGLVVLDLTLPLQTGEAVAAALRATHGPAVPILVITADGHAEAKARRVGAIGFLHKPFEMADLVGAVRHGLGNG